MNLRITPRVRRIQHSPTLWIHQRVKELRRGGGEVVHFGFGESPFPVPEPVLDALRAHAGESGYLPSQGLLELREQASEYLKWRFGHDADPERILVGPGSKELIFDALLAMRRRHPGMDDFYITDEDFLLDQRRGRGFLEAVRASDLPPLSISLLSSVKALSQYEPTEPGRSGGGAHP